MTVSSRAILTGVLVLLQLTAVNAHLLHHALSDRVSDDASACDETACTHAGCGCCSEVPLPDTESRTPHDCQDCALCAESDVQLIRTANGQRLVEAAMSVSANTQIAIAPLPPAIGACCTVECPSPSPEHLNALTLPLLN